MRALIGAAIAALCVAGAHAAEKLNVTQYGRIVATLPWAVALETGMFKQAGLDIDGVNAGAGGGTSVRNLLASSLPVGEVATSAAVAALKSGVPLKIIWTASNHPGELAWAVRPDSGIKSIKDLVGKKVGVPAGSSQTTMLPLFLKANGLKESDMTMLNMPPASMVPEIGRAHV